jgi:hypothetical protein
MMTCTIFWYMTSSSLVWLDGRNGGRYWFLLQGRRITEISRCRSFTWFNLKMQAVAECLPDYTASRFRRSFFPWCEDSRFMLIKTVYNLNFRIFNLGPFRKSEEHEKVLNWKAASISVPQISMNFNSTVLWDVTSCSPVAVHWRSGGTYWFYLPFRSLSHTKFEHEAGSKPTT